jgi:hypothetical protein
MRGTVNVGSSVLYLHTMFICVRVELVPSVYTAVQGWVFIKQPLKNGKCKDDVSFTPLGFSLIATKVLCVPVHAGVARFVRT